MLAVAWRVLLVIAGLVVYRRHHCLHLESQCVLGLRVQDTCGCQVSSSPPCLRGSMRRRRSFRIRNIIFASSCCDSSCVWRRPWPEFSGRNVRKGQRALVNSEGLRRCGHDVSRPVHAAIDAAVAGRGGPDRPLHDAASATTVPPPGSARGAAEPHSHSSPPNFEFKRSIPRFYRPLSSRFPDLVT